jgi:hypothetical protein
MVWNGRMKPSGSAPDSGLSESLCRGVRPGEPPKTRDSPGADFLRQAVRWA